MIEVPVTTAVTDQTPEVQPDCSIREGSDRLRDPSVPALIVRDSADEIVGIVTESDIVAVVAEGGTDHPVESCMSSPVVTVSPATPVGLAADRMRDAGVSLLPVVGEDEEYHGVVTRDSIAPYVSRRRLDITWDAEPLTLDRESTDTA